jgi:hypothetical protein
MTGPPKRVRTPRREILGGITETIIAPSGQQRAGVSLSRCTKISNRKLHGLLSSAPLTGNRDSPRVSWSAGSAKGLKRKPEGKR